MYNFRKIYSSNFHKVYFDTSFALLKIVALPETATFNDCTYKEEFDHILTATSQFTPRFCLINNAQDKFNLSAELQLWQQEKFFFQLKELGISKSATVISAEFILQSIQKTAHPDTQEALIPSQYFTNEEDALLWLVGSIKVKSRKKIIS